MIREVSLEKIVKRATELRIAGVAFAGINTINA
jgi:hypothetical protein